MKHISVRVPWHDNGWNSHVCANPRCNTFCKQLPNIVNSKVDCEQLSCGIDWSTYMLGIQTIHILSYYLQK